MAERSSFPGKHLPGLSPKPPHSGWSTRQRVLASIAALLVVLVTLVAICEWRGWPFLRQPLQAQLSEKLQREVTLGDGFRLHLLGRIDIKTDHFSIAPAPWQKTPPDETGFFTARDIHLLLPYSTVLGAIRGDGEALDISLLEAGNVEARLVREASGRANWVFGTALDENKHSNPADKGTAIPHFRKLVVHEGHLYLQDAVSRLQINAVAETRDGSSDNNPGLRVQADGSFQEKEFHATASSPGILPLVAPEKSHVPVALSAHVQTGSSTLRFEGHASDLLKFGGLTGDFSLAGPSLATTGDAVGVTLPTTAAFRMNGHVHKQTSSWNVSVAEFAVGQTRLSGKFRYDMAAVRPKLDGELRGTELALADLAPALGAPVASDADTNKTAVPRKNTKDNGRVLPQREFDIPALQRMDADVDIELDKVLLGSVFAQALQPLQGRLTLDRGELKLDRLLARTADGELRGQLLLDARKDIPLWASNLQWSGVKLEKWLSPRNNFARKSERIALKKPAGKTVAPPFISGQLGGQAKLRGSGRSTASMLSTLEGSVQVWVKDGSVSQLVMEGAGLDAAQALGLMVRGDKNIDLRCAAVSLQADKGRLRSDVGIVDTSDTLLLLNGDISLAEEKLDLTLRAKPHDASLLSLRAPLHVRGSFASPRVRPDAGTVGMKAGAAVLLGVVVTPLAAILPLIDPGSSSSHSGCQETLARLQQKPGTPEGMKQALGVNKKSTP